MIGLKKKTSITDSPYVCLLTTPPNDLLFNMVQWLHYDETTFLALTASLHQSIKPAFMEHQPQ